ncbi:hypothetical protein PH5382_03911 [Phaeobacter sp. CECT 5382]|uniref:hypothetical protein n=1 Tax=Phaeobacter sp. CECT 5382 TaxID=1712645 RepID=UPI0006DB3E3E|nr:hypothetical protein [Phaeobacter sp. CECT 5382]CUH89956.1 hypothetical protein PH5382_03911 [Phaeobacter sp. CECT 5382]
MNLNDLNMVLYCGAYSEKLDDVCEHAFRMGIPVRPLPSFHSMIKEVSNVSAPRSCVIINLDDLGGASEVIEELIAWRLDFPSIPTILVSGEFEVDDLDLHRLSICDCSIKSTSNPSSLHLALKQSFINNMIWAERQEERINADVDVGLRLSAALVISAISALMSGIFVLLEFRDWFYAMFAYIVVGQITLVTILISSLVRNWIEDKFSRFYFLKKFLLQKGKENQAKLGLDKFSAASPRKNRIR